MAQWKEITTLEEWDQALLRSKDEPVLIIKHSTRCPVSADAWKEYQEFVQENAPKSASYMMVKVIESRDVSNKIAEDLDIQHKSPQAILIKDGRAVWNDSHWHITKSSLSEAVKAV
ncbi:bacillithiol system redox-active protein YtxJ [Melghirimyces algeriensis]|uniref:Bacillithiol system protein YtxJ n=1 Tax=Melghirimyces algeriensis TaxID=910412 RepID=A0A521CLT2_9BACL|nr:bacillithiol system redox-active protein YtxJ [Melghirimyces algeriensis]SMO59711.1 bacillithiol system protein YtxJ [Melghirimyces algeriensis]